MKITYIILVTILFSTMSMADYYFRCPAENSNFYYGTNKDEMDFTVNVLSNASFSVSWTSKPKIIALLNLEYKCMSNNDNTNNWDTKKSDIILSLSSIMSGSEELSIDGILEGEVKCIVYGCFMDMDWYDLYRITPQEFVLKEPKAVDVIPSPSPSLNLPHHECVCTNEADSNPAPIEIALNGRKRSFSYALSNSEGNEWSVFPYVLSAVLAMVTLVLLIVNIFLLVRISRGKKATPQISNTTFLI